MKLATFSPWNVRALRLPPAWMLALAMLVRVPGAAAATEDTELLREAIDRWSNERDAWAFTQTVREFKEGHPQTVRVERYDPSSDDEHRWTLVTIEDRPPTDDEVAAFQRRKGSKRNRRARSPSDYVDFPRVAVVATGEDWVQYAVPLRDDINRLVPVEKLAVLITVDRRRRAVQELAIKLDDPMRIAFGLARVTDMNFDLRFEFADGSEESAPENVHPVGTARATMHKFGDQAEFSWSDFVRVAPSEARD